MIFNGDHQPLIAAVARRYRIMSVGPPSVAPRALPGRPWAPAKSRYPSSWRPMISFMISLVPPKIACTRESTKALAMGYSSM
jgi:hypothetical protein